TDCQKPGMKTIWVRHSSPATVAALGAGSFFKLEARCQRASVIIGANSSTASSRARDARNLNAGVALACEEENRMRYAPIRGVVWRTNKRADTERINQPDRAASRREYVSEAFSALARLLDRNEYDDMLAQWKSGLREIWLDNGFVMLRYTPPSGL